MSDTDDATARGRRLLARALHSSLKEQMEAFLARHERGDVVSVRSQISGETALSELVTEDRDERR